MGLPTGREEPQGMSPDAAAGFDWTLLVDDLGRRIERVLEAARNLEDAVTRLPAGGPRSSGLIRLVTPGT